MAKALRCDRCGKFYDRNHKVVENEGRKIMLSGMSFTQVINGSYYNAMSRDLCDDCLDRLVKFFDMVVIRPVGESVEDGPDD